MAKKVNQKLLDFILSLIELCLNIGKKHCEECAEEQV